jgi:hypothetical protein
VSDIFQEVDEEVRRERLKQLWDRYGTLIVILAFLVVAAIGGWRAYQWWDAKKAAENGARFESALALATDGKNADAEAAFAKIAAEGTSGYRTLARFQEATELARRDPAAAVKAYDAIAADSSLSSALQDLARVRAGLILVDTAPLEELRTRLAPAAEPGRPFRHSARELMAFASWRAGNAAETKRWVDMITADAESPQAVRSRVEMLSALTTPEAKS